MFAMPLDIFGSSSVQDQTDWVNAVVPDSLRDIVSCAELVTESVALSIEEQTSRSTKSLCSQEFDLGFGVFWIDETWKQHHQRLSDCPFAAERATCWVDLNLLEVDTLCANLHSHL